MILHVSVLTDKLAAYTSLTSEFGEIVDLASTLIRPTNILIDREFIDHFQQGSLEHWQQGVQQLFSFFGGVIQPLYFTAIHCVDCSIKDRAVALLAENPWREGAWDSSVMARIARRKIGEVKATYHEDYEIEGLDPYPVTPPWNFVENE